MKRHALNGPRTDGMAVKWMAVHSIAVNCSRRGWPGPGTTPDVDRAGDVPGLDAHLGGRASAAVARCEIGDPVSSSAGLRPPLASWCGGGCASTCKSCAAAAGIPFSCSPIPGVILGGECAFRVGVTENRTQPLLQRLSGACGQLPGRRPDRRRGIRPSSTCRQPVVGTTPPGNRPGDRSGIGLGIGCVT